MPGTTAALVLAAAIAAGLVFMAGHKRGGWSRRLDYPRGFDCGEQAGIQAERQRWEQVTGATYEPLLAGIASDVPDLPGNDGWPYLFTNLRAAGELREPPPADVLLAAADTMLGNPPRVPDAPPIVAGITDARPSGFATHEGDVRPELLDAFRRALAGDVPTVTGVVVTPRERGPDPAADWDLLAGAALPDYAAAALGGHRTVDELVDSIMMRKVGR